MLPGQPEELKNSRFRLSSIIRFLSLHLKVYFSTRGRPGGYVLLIINVYRDSNRQTRHARRSSRDCALDVSIPLHTYNHPTPEPEKHENLSSLTTLCEDFEANKANPRKSSRVKTGYVTNKVIGVDGGLWVQ